ncbi:MAG: hypothetical protein QNJ40_10095 [Xanthomonadales bacterium]|nr:hypothetical protein [Xanthomonadales bacterium]
MQINDIQNLWDHQPGPRPQRTAIDIIQQSKRRSTTNAVAMLVFFLLSLAMAGHLFWASFVSQAEALWIALIRSSLFVILAGIQFVMWRNARRQSFQRQSCQLKPVGCLREIRDDLTREAVSYSVPRAGAALLLIMVFAVMNKWMDYRLGIDTLSECVGIVAGIAAVCGMVAVAFWHYRTQFLQPRLKHIRRVLADLESSQGSP